jgi:hypothetical protein
LPLALLLGGCSSTDRGPWVSPVREPPSADTTVLMMGNSHTDYNALPMQLDALLRAGLAPRSVGTAVAPGWLFLDERLHDSASMQLLDGRPWGVVVLQAQKYSSSGRYTYSTREAEELVRRARRAGALPVLFPEWPRRGVDETARIYALHVSIARAAPACVAPVGQAWDRAAQRLPQLALHGADGNHAAPAGSYLAALMLYATISGASPSSLRALPDLANGVAPAVQAQLRQVAADTALATPPRQFCPDDTPRLGAARATRSTPTISLPSRHHPPTESAPRPVAAAAVTRFSGPGSWRESPWSARSWGG